MAAGAAWPPPRARSKGLPPRHWQPRRACGSAWLAPASPSVQCPPPPRRTRRCATRRYPSRPPPYARLPGLGQAMIWFMFRHQQPARHAFSSGVGQHKQGTYVVQKPAGAALPATAAESRGRRLTFGSSRIAQCGRRGLGSAEEPASEDKRAQTMERARTCSVARQCRSPLRAAPT